MARKPVGHEGFARRELHEERSRAVEQVVLTVGGARFVPFEAGPLPFAVGIGERNGVGGVPVDAAHGRLHRSGQSVAVVEAHDHRHLVGVEGGVLVAVVPVLADDPVRGLVEPRAPGRAVVRRYDHGGAGVSAGNPLPALREIALQFARGELDHVRLPVQAVVDLLRGAPRPAVVRAAEHDDAVVVLALFVLDAHVGPVGGEGHEVAVRQHEGIGVGEDPLVLLAARIGDDVAFEKQPPAGPVFQIGTRGIIDVEAVRGPLTAVMVEQDVGTVGQLFDAGVVRVVVARDALAEVDVAAVVHLDRRPCGDVGVGIDFVRALVQPPDGRQGQFLRFGGPSPVRSGCVVRVIAGQDAEAERRQGEFRDGLFHGVRFIEGPELSGIEPELGG